MNNVLARSRLHLPATCVCALLLLTSAVNAAVNPDSVSGGPTTIRWISNSAGSWHDPTHWEEGVVPVDGDTAGFGLNDDDLAFEEVDIDNGGEGVFLPSSVLRLERKMTFSDASAAGDPTLADDDMVFGSIQANGTGGSPAVFNVPVTADIISSNRHGAVFNRELTVNTILARSAHQDRWQLNAPTTAPILFLQIDEQRGPDGGDIDGSFRINAEADIEQLEHVWGRLVVGVDSRVTVGDYFYLTYVNQSEDNGINPLTLDGALTVTRFFVFDVALDSLVELAPGTYGSKANVESTFDLDFIEGAGLLTVLGSDELFADSFEGVPEVDVTGAD